METACATKERSAILVFQGGGMVCRLYDSGVLSAKICATTPTRGQECLKRLQMERLGFVVLVMQEISFQMLDWLEAMGKSGSLDCLAYIILPGSDVRFHNGWGLNLENAYTMKLSELQDFVGAVRLLYQVELNAQN